jgi:hypothetical protein
MIGRNWLLALVATGFVAAAPAAAQVSSTNPFDLPQAQRFEHGRPGRHHAWRMERRGGRMEWRGRHLGRRGERLERHGRWLRRHGYRGKGGAFARGHDWERHGNRLEHRGLRQDHRADRLRHRARQERRHRWHDGTV